MLHKWCFCGVHTEEGERNGAVEENTKSFLIVQLAVFLCSYHSFSAASKATSVYIILKEL